MNMYIFVYMYTYKTNILLTTQKRSFYIDIYSNLLTCLFSSIILHMYVCFRVCVSVCVSDLTSRERIWMYR